MLVFKVHKRKNYSIEGLHRYLLSQYHFFLSPRQAQQLIWSRFINTHGLPGHNVPADLYMEHLNRICICKVAVANLGANMYKTPNGLKHAGKCVGVLAEVQATYDKELHVTKRSGHHTYTVASTNKDKNIILGQLLEAKVFCNVDDRKHRYFENMQKNLLSSIKEKNLHEWMRDNLQIIKNKIYYSN